MSLLLLFVCFQIVLPLARSQCTAGADACHCIGMDNASPPHAGGECHPGNFCTKNGICRQTNAPVVTKEGASCTPGTVIDPQGSLCGRPSMNETVSYLGCVEKVPGELTCQICGPGSVDCACHENACSTAGDDYMCAMGRCVPKQGCENCPCIKGVCQGSLVCVSNQCTVVTPMPTPMPGPCDGNAGAQDCPCAKDQKSGQFGCLERTLKCRGGMCVRESTTSASTRSVPFALLVAVLAAATNMQYNK